MLLNGPNWRQHRFWVLLFLLGTIAASVWYFVHAFSSEVWPGGSSMPGFIFGVVGGLICVFEFLLWVRKKLRVWRVGRTQAWMRAHIWLGLLCVPLLVYHSGFRVWGGTLSTVLFWVLLLVVLSGIYGLVLQNLVPTKMFEEIPAETIYSQIDNLAHRLHAEGAVLVAQLCGEEFQLESAAPARRAEGVAVVGAMRPVGVAAGKIVDTRTAPQPVAGAEPLGVFFRDQLTPYLLEGKTTGSPLADANRASVVFHNLRALTPPETHAAVARLEDFSRQRRQWDRQTRMHFWLHSWLLVHFPLSVALLVLMFIHVFVALKFY